MSSKKPSIDQALIRDLAALLKEADLSEIEIEQDDLRIRVSRGGVPHFGHYAVPAGAAPAAAAGETETEESQEAQEAGSDPAKHPGVVPSPMVGTAYLASAPDTPPFVNVGDRVKAGQTIMIVEAMKTMNQIPAPRAGTVSAILVEDKQPVEYGEPLMIIE